MGSSYEIRVYDPLGATLLATPKVIAINDEGGGLELGLAVNGIGRLLLDFPRSINPDFFPFDGRIEVWRQLDGGRPYVVGQKQWLIRRRRRTRNFIRILGLDPNYLTTRRYVLYDSESLEANKTAEFDDMMKAIIRENMGSLATDTDRDLSSYLTVQPDFSLAPSDTKEFSWRNVYDVLREICDSSATQGTYLAFDIVRTAPNMLEFRTYTGQRGIDHRWPAGTSPILLSEEQGSLSKCELIEDAEDEATHITAIGRGIGAARLFATAEDTARIGLSPFGRREYVRNSSYTDTPDVIDSDAQDELRARRPHIYYSAQLNDTRGLQYGKEYDIGDYLTAGMENTLFDCRLDGLRIKADETTEEVTAILRAEV